MRILLKHDEIKLISDVFGRMPKQKFCINVFDHFLNRTFFTCPDKRTLTSDLWLPGEPNNIMMMEASVALVLGKSRKMSGLEDINGLLEIFAFCQVCDSHRRVMCFPLKPHGVKYIEYIDTHTLTKIFKH